ncbi:MAG: O-antigen ligase family protein [Novosphingobium sp.]
MRPGAGSAQPGAILAAGYLALAIALGGGGSPAPFPELILELAAALLALFVLSFSLPPLDWQRIPRPAWIIAGLVAAIPLIQLIPLPPFIWQALPGRDLQVKALALIGAEDSWRPLSLAPSRTLAALLSLGPPLLMLLMTSALGRRDRLWLFRSIAVMTLATMLLGALQLSAGNDSPFHLYGVTVPMLVGFQANHNSTADMLLIGLIAVPLLLVDLVERRVLPNRAATILGIAGAVCAVIALGVVLTASRMGIFLMPIALAAGLWILRPWIRLTPRRLGYAAAILAALLILGLMIVRDNPVLGSVLARFDFGDELRPQLWVDGAFIAQKYFPFGVGMGDFVPAFIADERIESIWPSLPNRAHNDFLELTIEAGLVGMTALSAISWLLIRALRQRLKEDSGVPAAMSVFAAASLAILALHSLVDYPFRSMALACLGAVCAGLLLSPRQNGEAASSALGAGKTR